MKAFCGVKLQPGAICDGTRGYCDVFQKCRRSDEQGPLTRLEQALFGRRTINSVRDYIIAHPFFAAVYLVLFVAIMVLFFRCFSLHTPSNNPHKPSRKLKETLRNPKSFFFFRNFALCDLPPSWVCAVIKGFRININRTPRASNEARVLELEIEEAELKQAFGNERWSRVCHWRQRMRSRVQKRTRFLGGQDTIGETVWKPILCLAIVFLLLAGIIAFLLITKENSSGTLQHCKLLMCTDPYEALGSLLNYTVKPCDDMYAHVCSRWTSNAEHAGFLQESLDYYLTKMHDIFETSDVNAVGEGLIDGLRTGGILFSQCLAAMKGKELIQKESVVLMQELFLKRIIDSKTPTEAVREGTEISFTFNLNGLLTLRPQRTDTTVVMYAFKGSAVKTSLPATADVKQCVSDFLTSTAIVTDVRTVANAVLLLDRIVATYHSRAKSLHKKIPARLLGEVSPTLKALVANPMERLTKMSSLSEGYLLVRDYESTVDLVRFFTRPSGLHISWYLVVQMLVDLLLFDYVGRYELNDKWQALRACSGVVNKALSHVWSSLSRQMMLNKTSRDPITELFENVRMELTSNNSYLHKFVSDTTFSRLRHALGNISFVSNRELLEHQRKLVLGSSLLTPSNQPFVRSYVDVRQKTRSVSLTWPPGVLCDIAAILELELTPSYRDETNSLFLSTALEMPHVFYSDDTARMLNYGVLGAAVARELILAVVPGAQLDERRALWTSEAARQLLNRMKCYVDTAVAHHKRNETDDFKLELFPWLMSARVAYDALRRHFRFSQLDNSTWKTVQRQFFLRFCLAACQSSNATVVSARDKCIWPLSGNPAFTEAFDCPDTSRMSRQVCRT
ncbi:hypothetical protein HPB49_023232 [Dermacentor silvarum]|uniref:Uncharacterized protein n=1 Tax=Dermacentor silvarum TaxID=543639 RepID=A0ACB8CNA0_DERSI|nr:hypothetical protein HPB49_023232 [Dermacentor silvarum]